jgi:hypothetical protein
MRRVPTLLLALSMTATATIALAGRSRAENGQVAAGIIGGLAAGTLLGAAVAQPRYYAPAPVYVVPPPTCYWTRGHVRPDWGPHVNKRHV